MHMMIGGVGALTLVFLIALLVIGPVVWGYLPAILATIAGGTAIGLGAALVAEPQRRRARTRAVARHCCPGCGSPVSPTLAVCPTCLRDLKTNCSHCGAVRGVGAERCPACGQAVQPLPSHPRGAGKPTPKEVPR